MKSTNALMLVRDFSHNTNNSGEYKTQFFKYLDMYGLSFLRLITCSDHSLVFYISYIGQSTTYKVEVQPTFNGYVVVDEPRFSKILERWLNQQSKPND